VIISLLLYPLVAFIGTLLLLGTAVFSGVNMTTSNQTIYQLTRDTIIAAAMRKIGALAKGQSPDAEDLTNGAEALNSLMVEYQTLGLPLWKRTEYTLPLVIGTASYTIGVSQTINTPFPIKMDSIVMRETSGAPRILIATPRSEFNLLNTETTGKPVNFTYQPFINYGVLKVWPSPDAADNLELTYHIAAEGFTAAGETPDFPQEWRNALVYGLAVALAPEYGVPLNDRQHLAKEHEKHLQTALDFGYENASIYIQIAQK
jgi:hypothetical protein